VRSCTLRDLHSRKFEIILCSAWSNFFTFFFVEKSRRF
jgi:hypothetical protein